jgi:hypothetical protein
MLEKTDVISSTEVLIISNILSESIKINSQREPLIIEHILNNKLIEFFDLFV